MKCPRDASNLFFQWSPGEDWLIQLSASWNELLFGLKYHPDARGIGISVGPFILLVLWP